jgi:hypothetical protein
MSDGSLRTQRTVLRIAVAFGLPWLGLLLAISLSGLLVMGPELDDRSFLIATLTALNLVPLSIIVVPACVFVHARLCDRGNVRLAPHCATGALVAAASLLLFVWVDRLLGMNLSPGVFGVPLLPALLAAAIGAANSMIVWCFVVRPLRAKKEDILRTFE